MKAILLICVIFLCVLSMTVQKRKKHDKKWKKYLKNFAKNYEPEEEARRRKIWEKNVKMIKKHNKDYKRGDHKYRMGLNHMSDWTEEEYEKHTCVIDTEAHSSIEEYEVKCDKKCRSELPKEVDWRDKKIITPVKNQGHCGSCWAFGTVGALEAHYALKTKDLVELSEQELVDCSSNKEYGNLGCRGGLPAQALNYVKRNGGISTERKYPYTGVQGQCRKNSRGNKAAIRTYKRLTRFDEDNLKAVVARSGPVIAGIDVMNSFFRYKHGVYHDQFCNKDHQSHVILIVGYGEYEGTPYWLIKNSWGKKWGMKGYAMMARNQNSHCAIASFTLIPVM